MKFPLVNGSFSHCDQLDKDYFHAHLVTSVSSLQVTVKRSDASETEVQVLDGVETNWK